VSFRTIPQYSHLSGAEGELVSVRIATEPRLLEDLLECLATVHFPINPQIFHGLPTVVEFPAYEGRLLEVQSALRASGFDPASAKISSMLTAISA
jgi:hypothetical protein